MSFRSVVVVGAMVASLGTASAAYAGNGVGPSPDTTGSARACQAHAANQGNSKANGLTCATLAATVEHSGCTVSVTGSGLKPGSSLIVSNQSGGTYNGPQPPDLVQADGTINITRLILDPNNYVIQGTTARGAAITTTFSVPDCG